MLFRAGRSVLVKKKEGSNVQHIVFLFLENCFRGLHGILFDVGNSVPPHLANSIPLGSFQCSLQGIKTRPHAWCLVSYHMYG